MDRKVEWMDKEVGTAGGQAKNQVELGAGAGVPMAEMAGTGVFVLACVIRLAYPMVDEDVRAHSPAPSTVRAHDSSR